MWLRVFKDNAKACIPGKPMARRLWRTLVPYRSMPGNDDLAFDQGVQLIAFIHEHDISLGTVIEVGTGWIPTIPHILKACGAGRIILTDIDRLSDEQTFAHARALVESDLPRIARASGIDEATLHANLNRSGVEDYRSPPVLDDLAAGSVDLIYSRTVLEHIRPPVLERLLGDWRRLLRPRGFCVHFIDNSDHFEHDDDRLSRLNFLTLSDFAWRIAAFNGQNYQNRLRHSDYVRLFRDAGFELLHVEAELDERALADLDRLAIQERFRRYDREDLATVTTTIVARNPAA